MGGLKERVKVQMLICEQTQCPSSSSDNPLAPVLCGNLPSSYSKHNRALLSTGWGSCPLPLTPCLSQAAKACFCFQSRFVLHKKTQQGTARDVLHLFHSVTAPACPCIYVHGRDNTDVRQSWTSLEDSPCWQDTASSVPIASMATSQVGN